MVFTSVRSAHWKGQRPVASAGYHFYVLCWRSYCILTRKICQCEFCRRVLKIFLRSIIFSLSFWKNIFLSIYITTSEFKNVPEFWKKLKNIFCLATCRQEEKVFLLSVCELLHPSLKNFFDNLIRLYSEGITLVIPPKHRMFLLSREEAERLLITETGCGKKRIAIK